MGIRWSSAARRLSACVLVAVANASLAADEIRYVVRPGDDPWRITERHLRGVTYWPRLVRLNRIKRTRNTWCRGPCCASRPTG